MSAAAQFLTIQQFEEAYAGQKPYYEYWFGEAVQKSMPTGLHGVLQIVLASMLMARGWKVASEVKLKLSTVANPIPDLIADLKPIQDPYPTKPFLLCVEILSPDDDLRRIFQKGANYLGWGIGYVWIIDPDQGKAYSMSLEQPKPVELTREDTLIAPPGKPLPLAELFAEVDRMSA